MITSGTFGKYFESIKRAVSSDVLDDVIPEDFARLIVGLAPKKSEFKLYLSQIVNGPFDVDKLDYQARDGYFTGIAFRVDVDRLLASIRVVNSTSGGKYLAVDHRGVAAIEQLLFNRMLLYDSVYHHHKNRAAVCLFGDTIRNHETLPLEWLLRHDESDFFGLRDIKKSKAKIKQLVERLRKRDLPHRAVVIHPATVNNVAEQESMWQQYILKYFSSDPRDKTQAETWFSGIRKVIKDHLANDQSDEFYLDLPTPPKFQELQRGTYIEYSGRTPLVLDDVFPITSAINSYAQQCKYRIYVFAGRDNRENVAAAAFNVFKEHGLILNEEAFRQAKLDPTVVGQRAGQAIPARNT